VSNVKSELKRVVNKIKDKALRDKIVDLIQNPTMRIGDKTYEGLPLEVSPASKRLHHSYREGLMQHIISSSGIALTLCDIAERIYHAKVDRDIVLTAVVVHDLMKPLTYSLKGKENYEMSQLGEQMDHLTLVVSELIGRGFPLEVIHAVAAHHGENGPVGPRTVEALICFLSDSTDAALNGEVLKAAKSLVEMCAGEQAGQLDAEEAFAIVHAKQSQGCEGVREVFEEIRRRRRK